jgi:hypothetical protein
MTTYRQLYMDSLRVEMDKLAKWEEKKDWEKYARQVYKWDYQLERKKPPRCPAPNICTLALEYDLDRLRILAWFMDAWDVGLWKPRQVPYEREEYLLENLNNIKDEIKDSRLYLLGMAEVFLRHTEDYWKGSEEDFVRYMRNVRMKEKFYEPPSLVWDADMCVYLGLTSRMEIIARQLWPEAFRGKEKLIEDRKSAYCVGGLAIESALLWVEAGKTGNKNLARDAVEKVFEAKYVLDRLGGEEYDCYAGNFFCIDSWPLYIEAEFGLNDKLDVDKYCRYFKCAATAFPLFRRKILAEKLVMPPLDVSEFPSRETLAQLYKNRSRSR